MRPYPFERLPFPRLDEPFPAPANIKRHEQVEVGIEVARECQWREALLLDDDTQFLPQFSDQALLRLLAGLDLAAGKLPQPCHRLARWALCDQYTPIRVNQRAGGNENKFDAHGLASV